MASSLLFGIATFRARVLPHWPAGLLAVAAWMIPVAALFPHAIQRVVGGMPIGIAFAWLGYTLLSERQETITQAATQSVPGWEASPIPQTGDKKVG